MKKSTILIAVFAVMASASSMVSAAGIDFDGKTPDSLRSVDFAIAINQETPEIPAPVMAEADAFDIQNEEYELNRSIGSAIRDCDIKGFVALKPKFEKLLTMGSLQEKRDFVYNTNRSYDFPRRLFTGTEKTFAGVADTANDSHKMNKACLTWEKKQECTTTTGRKEVCHTSCAAATLVCLAVAGATAPVCAWAAPVCTIACSFVDDTVTTCVDYYVCAVEGSWPGMQPVN